MAKIEIVEFENGKYGVRKKSWFMFTEYYGARYWWSNPKSIVAFCQHSLEEAKYIYNTINLKVKKVVDLNGK